MATKKSQRIAIWVIAVVMAVGTLGAYFIVILDNANSQREQERLQQQYEEELQKAQSAEPDPSAHKVDGDVTTLAKEDLVVGNGAEVKVGDTIRVHYKGTIAQTGVKFDSSYDRGEPAEFALKEPTAGEPGVIKGWVEGLQGMKEGGKRRLVVPSELAYGEQGNGSIPPNADLVFEVEVQAVVIQ